MRVFFIYDTTYCKADEDDPKDAVLYFFPSQTYENQCYSLCCQIVGVAKFFKATFSSPSLIVLDQGKFALHWSGKYLLVLGGSPDVHGNILKKHLMFLCGIFCFYHGSINNLLKICKNDRKEFLIKMEIAWSRYITLAQCFNNLLQLSVNALPLTFVKKHADAVGKANQLLHMCQLSASVIAGAVFCNSRVLSSQLTPELTSYLTLMSNENASSPVSSVMTTVKNLPPDVELKYVYLSRRILQSILRYNHIYVGSSVRVKLNEAPHMHLTAQSHSHFESISSGSEGDVDSGNCTESAHHAKEALELNEAKTASPSCFELNLKAQLLCCCMHSSIFKRDLWKSRNKTFLKYLKSEFISEKLKAFEKKVSACSSVNAKSKPSKRKMGSRTTNIDKASSCNVLCYHHANIFSSNFVTKSVYEHLNLSSTCDMEYSCHFCINNRVSTNVKSVSLKKWNSNMHIPEYVSHIPLKPCVLECSLSKDGHKKEKASKCKVQILKCRTKSDASSQPERNQYFRSNHSKKRSNENTVFDLKSRTSKHQVYHISPNLCDIERNIENVESNSLEKTVLYVQRCGTNMLTLLLSKNYDENILTYLWNCGFTFLKDLDYQAEKKVEESNEVDPAHYILVYDNVQKVLKERPHYHGSVFSEKHVKESVQSIQEDFQANPKMQMFSLISANQSIFACQTKQQSAFYLQQDQSARKSESLCNLSKRAVRRLEKYMKFSA